MATDGFASRVDGVQYAAVDERRMDSGLMMPGPASDPFSVRSGRRVNGAGLQASVGGGPEAWTVTSGVGFIFDSAYASQGAWRFEIPNDVSAALPARPGSGQSRIDLIVARIYENAAIGSGLTEVKIERVTGAVGATPSAPSLPALSLELARLTVPASGTIVVAQSGRRTVAAGGVLPLATTAEMDALKTDGVAYRGLVVDNAQTNALHRYDGTAFRRVGQDAGVFVGSPYWGVAFNPDIHRYVTYSQTLVATPNAQGNIAFINPLGSIFAGVGSAVATPADSVNTSARQVVMNIGSDGITLGATLYSGNGTALTAAAGSERINLIVHGWA